MHGTGFESERQAKQVRGNPVINKAPYVLKHRALGKQETRVDAGFTAKTRDYLIAEEREVALKLGSCRNNNGEQGTEEVPHTHVIQFVIHENILAKPSFIECKKIPYHSTSS